MSKSRNAPVATRFSPTAFAAEREDRRERQTGKSTSLDGVLRSRRLPDGKGPERPAETDDRNGRGTTRGPPSQMENYCDKACA